MQNKDKKREREREGERERVAFVHLTSASAQRTAARSEPGTRRSAPKPHAPCPCTLEQRSRATLYQGMQVKMRSAAARTGCRDGGHHGELLESFILYTLYFIPWRAAGELADCVAEPLELGL